MGEVLNGVGEVLGGWEECWVGGSSVGWVGAVLGGWKECRVSGSSVGWVKC